MTASRRLMSLVFLCAIATSVSAVTYTGGPEYTAGSGSNQATIVVDFDFDNYFLFTYYWDGDAMGWDALNAIDLAGALEVEATDWGEWGMFVDDLSYPDGVKYDYGAGFETGWAYYVGDNQSWALDGSGVSFRSLSNGDWDSWVWTNYDESWMPVRGPGGQPIPEPVSIVLLGLGGLFLRRRRISVV
jgi:hypothetical protein